MKPVRCATTWCALIVCGALTTAPAAATPLDEHRQEEAS